MGADPTILDKRGFTPIDVIPAQSKEIFSIIINSSHLLVYHALTNPKGGLLHLALRKNLATAIIVRDELLKYFNQESLRDFLNLTDAEGNNPLHIASLVGYPDLIFFCLQYGAKLYSCNKKGLIPDQSARGEHLGIFQNYFKQILIPVLEQYEQKYKERAIFYMAAQGQAALLYAMGKRTITSLVEPVSGYSTLQIAAGYGHAEAVQVLLMQGADPYGKGGRRNRSTWEIARTKNKDQKISEGRKQVLAVLKEWKQKARHKYESKPIEEQAASEKDLLELTALIQSANINEPEPHERKESDYPPPRVIIPASKIRPVASFLENLDETIHLQMAGNNKILRAKW
jgi:ankyrin repeat protein